MAKMPRMSNMHTDRVLELLASGEMRTLGLMPWGSNYTFLVEIDDPDQQYLPEDQRSALLGVYKPRRGEAPLWDFPTGTLCVREYAAWLVNEALGWQIIPPTVLREGEHGFGSVQLFIDNDPDTHYFTFKDDPDCREQLQRICAFDLVCNNADRKSGHCLRDKQGQVWAIDQGLCFNCDYKLRSVIWNFASQPICKEHLAALGKLRASLHPSRALGAALRGLLEAEEVRAFEKRVDGLLKIKTYPTPNRHERSMPWPPV